MPRISKYNGQYNENLDFCFSCYPKAKNKFPESQDFVDYPGYEECLGYECEICKKRLTESNG